MPAPQFFHQFTEDLCKGVHQFGTHAIKVLLTNDAPGPSADAVKADLPSELSGGSGYTAGGHAVTTTSCEQTSGVTKLVLADVTITASGGSIGPFRYAVLYNDTPTSPADPLVCFVDYGQSTTLSSGQSLTIDFDGSNGLFTL